MPQATTCLASHFDARFRLQLIESVVCIAWQALGMLWACSGHARRDASIFEARKPYRPHGMRIRA
jgi:hypothetical protein